MVIRSHDGVGTIKKEDIHSIHIYERSSSSLVIHHVFYRDYRKRMKERKDGDS